MKKSTIFVLVIFGLGIYSTAVLGADVCKICPPDKLICLEREPCEPMNEFLIRAAKRCREDEEVRSVAISKFVFVDVLSRLIRLDREFPEINRLEGVERYVVEATLLSEKGIDIFSETNPNEPLTRKELATVLKEVFIEENLGYSNGLSDQSFKLNNYEFVIYDAKVYVDEGNGLELWERKRGFDQSLSENKHYSIKIDSCNNASVAFGDSKKGRIPVVGSKIKASYRLYGKDKEIVTECEVAGLLSNLYLARSIKNAYNPSRPLTRTTFADLLIKALHLDKQMPRNTASLTDEELYLIQGKILSKNGIDVFTQGGPNTMLTREELAKVLYNYPVERVIGISSGARNQFFELENAGFVIYDLHTYVDEGAGYKEWEKENSFIESSSQDENYVVKLDAGTYAKLYFGDDKKGKIPAVNSPIKVSYRLYAPVNMFTEDDIICMLNFPVAETYIPPTGPPEYPPPTDGFDDPATHT
ncbi:MAG: hypothetical protein KJ902_01655 [Candidatus Omnitrophica bacterium]|nr:hypothetical protein [Candidatus Omnitrophota bacterium]